MTFDSFMNKARDVADIAARKTGEAVEVSKQKLAALKLSNSIQKAYEELGAAYYRSVKFGGNEEQLRAGAEEVERLLKEQEELNKSMGEVGKEPQYCRSCGTENAHDASFCSKCGSPLRSAAADSDPVVVETIISEEE